MKMTKSPREKYSEPQTSGQEYGWDTSLLVNINHSIYKLYLKPFHRLHPCEIADFTIRRCRVRLRSTMVLPVNHKIKSRLL